MFSAEFHPGESAGGDESADEQNQDDRIQPASMRGLDGAEDEHADGGLINAVPGRSSGEWLASLDEGMVKLTSRMSPDTTARLTKIAIHDHFSRSAPDTSIPAMAPEPATPDQMPTARPRCDGGKPAVSSDSVAGITKAAPTPAATRDPMIHSGASLMRAPRWRRRKRAVPA